MLINGLDIRYDQVENSRGLIIIVLSFIVPNEYYIDVTFNKSDLSNRDYALSQGYSVLSINFPGMGNSLMINNYTVEDFYNDIVSIFTQLNIQEQNLILLSNSAACKVCWLLSARLNIRLNLFFNPGGWPCRSKLVLTHYGLTTACDKQILTCSIDQLFNQLTKLPNYYENLNLVREKLSPFFDENGNKQIPLSIYHNSYKLIFERTVVKGAVPTIVITSPLDDLSYSKELVTNMNASIIEISNMSHYWHSSIHKAEIFKNLITIIGENYFE